MKDIKEMLLQEPEHIENILTTMGFYKVRIYRDEIICGNSPDGKGQSIHIKLNEYINCRDFKFNVKGDLFSFLMKKRQLELFDVLNIVKQELGIDSFSFSTKQENKVFGGAYRKIKKNIKKEVEYTILSEDILVPYVNKFNTKFFYDGISFETQKKFQIGIDFQSQRITIPWRNYMGELVGIMGRYLGNDDGVARWMPIIPFPKLDVLYGYSENYKHLVECDELYVGESEKHTLQLDSKGINTCVSLGRNEISSYQIKRIIALNPKKIIYCLDEGLPEEIIIKNVKLTQQFLKYRDIKVGYTWDGNNEILPKDSKASPSDLETDMFMRLVKEKVKEVVCC